jgi:tetratricopeptide (TPR) repeat protein
LCRILPRRVQKPSDRQQKILIVVANPPANLDSNAARRLEEEVRNIQRTLRGAEHRDRFELVERWAARSRDLHQALLEEEPQFVHLLAHGSEAGEVALEDEQAGHRFVTPQALAELFQLFAGVQCVLLNVRYSQPTAAAIAQYIPYAIGMRQEVDRQGALAFAGAFYDALGTGRTIPFAYELGCNALEREGVTIQEPVLATNPAATETAAPTAVTIPQNLPRSGTIAFVGREQELERLHDQLQQAAPGTITAITGMGGIGKTELALQYAQRQHQQRSYLGGLCWLRAKDPDLGTQLITFASLHLGITPPEDLDLATQIAFCWRQWPDGDALIWLDDVLDYSTIKPYLPPVDRRFKVLLTTRVQLGRSVQPLAIDILEEAAALNLLRALTDVERIDRQLDEAKQLCHWLGYLPLGLELVGRHLVRKPDLSLSTLQQRLQQKRLDAKALTQADADMTATHESLAAAFALSWQDLPPDTQRLSYLLSLFALAPLPWELVETCLPEIDREDLEDLRDDGLVQRSLLQRVAANTYQLHQLIREFFRTQLDRATEQNSEPADELKRRVCQSLIAIARKIPYTPTRAQLLTVVPAIPHLSEIATELEPWVSDDDLTLPYVGLGRFYAGQGLYAAAEPWYYHCLTATRKRLGENHPAVPTSLNNLALLYHSQGRYEQAEPLFLQALELRQRLVGENHPDVATSLNNLAGLYYYQRRYTDAEPLFRQALDLRQRLLGEEHPSTAISYGNLAALYKAQQRYAEAEELYLRALRVFESRLG